MRLFLLLVIVFSMDVFGDIEDSLPQDFNLLSPVNGDTAEVFPVKLVWESSENAESYMVYMGGHRNTVSYAGELIQDTTYTIDYQPNRVGGGSFYWKITARNDHGTHSSSGDEGEGAYSSGCWPVDAPVTSRPDVLSPDACVEADSICFMWSTIAHADSFDAQVSRTADFSDLMLDTTMADTMVIVRGFEEYNYHYRVRAFNDAGPKGPWKTSGFYVDFPVQPEDTIPDPPTLDLPFNGDTLTFDQFVIEWTSPQDSFRILISTSPEFADTFADTTLVYCFCEFKFSEGSWYWKVKALDYDYGYWSDWSEVYSFTIDLPYTTGTKMITKDMKQSKPNVFSVYDLQGRKIESNITQDVMKRHMAKGHYILKGKETRILDNVMH